jgi:hypothetical protein
MSTFSFPETTGSYSGISYKVPDFITIIVVSRDTRTPNRITIPQNMRFKITDRTPFEYRYYFSEFAAFYIANGRKAGTYTAPQDDYSGWSYKP